MSSLFGKMTAPLFGTGIGKIPGVWTAYKWMWQINRPKNHLPVKVQDFYMYLDSNDYIMAPQLFSTGYWEKYETQLFKQYVKEGMTVVDIGANIGYYSLIASKIVSDKGKVYCFEPMPNTYQILVNNIAINHDKNVYAFNKAVTDREDIARLHLDSRTPASNSLSDNGKYIDVETTTIDKVIGNNKVDIIKMDIEGSEMLAYKGMVDTIKNNRNLVMFTEVCDKKLITTGSSMQEYVSELLKCFDIAVIDEHNQELICCEEVNDVVNLAKYKTMINLLCIRRGNGKILD